MSHTNPNPNSSLNLEQVFTDGLDALHLYRLMKANLLASNANQAQASIKLSFGVRVWFVEPEYLTSNHNVVSK